MSKSKVRPRPCASCPYRRDVPSGIWDAGEYDKLPRYDAGTWEQPPEAFSCHQADGFICAGWAGTHDMSETLAARLGVIAGNIDPAIFTYSTDIPLFGSGTEAAEHGKRDITSPDLDAREMISHLTEVRTRKDGK
jgi:hypothetical protein